MANAESGSGGCAIVALVFFWLTILGAVGETQKQLKRIETMLDKQSRIHNASIAVETSQ